MAEIPSAQPASLPDKSRRKRRKQTRKKKVRVRSVGIGHNRGPPLDALLDDRVLTFNEWCALNGICKRTGYRILNGPDPPLVVQLSPHRIGVRVADNRAWQQRRTRPRSGGL
jgi:hypothetical protein